MELFNYYLLNIFSKKQLICFFLLVGNSLFSQNTIYGIILSADKKPVEDATIILKRNNNTISFTISNELGYFSLNSKKNSDYVLKISHISFSPFLKEINTQEEKVNLGSIILLKNENQLSEVIIKANNNKLIIKGDTTTYKLDRFLNGTENTLKDIIETVPGLEINEQGKIINRGKEIDKLLIDGEDLYKSQHQLATENLSADMIKNLELIKNYTNFDSLEKEKKSNITALNINIKDSYKNKITGALNPNIGYKNKYKIKGSVFNFRKKTKTSIISSINNTGETPIGVDDFLKLTKHTTEPEKGNNSSVIFTSLNELPRFLTNGDNAIKRETRYISLSNIINPTKKIKLDFFGIYNHTKQNELFINELINPSFNAALIETKKISESNHYVVTQLKSVFKTNSNEIITLNNNLNIDNNNQHQNISSINNIEEHFTPRKLILINNISYKKKIKSNLLNTNVFYTFSNKKDNLNIEASNPFLTITDPTIKQNYKNSTSKLGMNIDYQFKIKNIAVTTYLNSFYKNSQFNSKTDHTNYLENNLNLNSKHLTLGISNSFRINNLLNLTTDLNYNIRKNNLNKILVPLNYLGIKSKLKATFNNNNIGDLSYQYSNSETSILNLLSNELIIDYRNTIVNDNVKLNSFLPYHQISYNHFIFNPKKKYSLIMNISHKEQVRSINNNINISNNNTITNKILTNKDSQSNFFLFFEKELKRVTLSNSFSLRKISYQFSQNNSLDRFSNRTISGKLNLKSTSKNQLIHFEFGVKYSFDKYTNNSHSSNLEAYSPYINFKGNISKKTTWKLNSSYKKYNANNATRELYFISPSLNYSTKKIDYYIEGYNLLNLKNQTIIENSSTENYFQKRTTATLNGYLLFGLKFKF